MILDEISDDKIGVNLKFLFATSIEQLYKDVDFLFVDVCTINDMNDVFLSKYDWSFSTDPLALMKQYHT